MLKNILGDPGAARSPDDAMFLGRPQDTKSSRNELNRRNLSQIAAPWNRIKFLASVIGDTSQFAYLVKFSLDFQVRRL